MNANQSLRRSVVWILAVCVLAAAGAFWLLQSAKTQQANDRVVAQAAILGRWSVTVPGGVGRFFLLNFPAHGRPTCLYGGGMSPALVSYSVRQTPLRARVWDRIKRLPVPSPLYDISIADGPAANPAGRPWQGHLIGDGNVLVLVSASSGAATALHRLGSS